MPNKSYTETVAGKVKKYNDTRAGRKFFNSFVLLNDPEYLRKHPEWRGPLAFCIYCSKVQQERKFAELHAKTFIPYNGSRRLRHGVCRECSQNISKKKNSKSSAQ